MLVSWVKWATEQFAGWRPLLLPFLPKGSPEKEMHFDWGNPG